ncbi:MAG: IS5 family transposase [Candidatus Poribacteria bacterium]|nr:IS5 family transposase [Candidatus Poribacteria bacterium]
MYLKQLQIFKELTPYSGQIDTNNRWIKLAELVPWDEMDGIYRKHFDEGKQSVIKDCRLILGLILGQMLLELSDRDIVEYFHENPYFQYFCGQDTFVAKITSSVIHPSLLSKRRKRLGKAYVQKFEQEILRVLKNKGLIKGKKLILDATVFPANITYPNDVKLLNTVREYLCKTILNVKNSFDPKGRIRTYRRIARKAYLNFQKTKKKSKQLIRRTRKQMIQYVNRNIKQLEVVLEEVTRLKQWQVDQIRSHISVAKQILEQQVHMATTRGRHVSNRIVSFHWPQIRPMVRGKDGKAVEFGPKAHVALVDGFAFLDHAQYDAFHEGIQLKDCLLKHNDRFGRHPEILLADQLYANRDNRKLLEELSILHAFKRMGRPPAESPNEKQERRRSFKKNQGRRNHIEATFGHLKNHFNLAKIKWTIPDGALMQIQLGLIAFNLSSSLAKS